MWKMTWIQLMNRWRSNVWVCVELLLAFCLAWYMVDYFFVTFVFLTSVSTV